MGAKKLIILNEEACVGCNKCIANCPIPDANTSYSVDGKIKVKTNSEKCIHCGKCIEVCDHKARDFIDDTERFFNDLKQGKTISVIAAPSIRANFSNYNKLLGYLKAMGVRTVYDVSFGADITTWAYLKAMKERNLSSVIAQPCPVVVNYIEEYQPELLSNLAPIHSPMMCTAVYMKKYANINDSLAFLSPCISKSDEINDKNTGGYIEYNVTFNKLEKYIKENAVDLSVYEEKDFEDMGPFLGVLFSRPGGLRENVEARVKDVWVRQIEGQGHIYPYFKKYEENLKNGKPVPNLVDVLNCPQGCNFGTGTCNSLSIDEVDESFNQLKKSKLDDSGKKIVRKKIDWLYDYFDKNLKLEDFERKYSRNEVISSITEPTEAEYDEIFNKMHKTTDESRRINCTACGYGSCEKMARAIFNNLNTLSNCIDYNRHELEIQLQNKSEQLNALDELNRLSKERIENSEKLQKRIREIIESVDDVSQGNEESAMQIEGISTEMADILSTSDILRNSVDKMEDRLRKYKEASAKIVDISNQTNMLSLNASIEAARAGENGKGFSVVANEVKNLSLQTKDIVESTRADIDEMVRLVNEILKISDELDKRVTKVNDSVSNASAAIEEVTARGQEIAATAKIIIEESE